MWAASLKIASDPLNTPPTTSAIRKTKAIPEAIKRRLSTFLVTEFESGSI